MARPLYGGSYFGQGLPPSSYIDPYAAYSFGYRSEQPLPDPVHPLPTSSHSGLAGVPRSERERARKRPRQMYDSLLHLYNFFLNAACRCVWRDTDMCLFVQDG